MARRNVTLEIRARNALQKGLASAGKQLQAFGQSAARIGKMFAKGFLVAGAALVGFGIKAVSAHARQEKAVRDLTSALNAYGDDSVALVPILKAQADAIQDETSASNDQTLAKMAQLRVLGVMPEKLGSAYKGVIALENAGVGLNTALRATSAAMQGNFTALTRYIPALRDANTEAEKAAIVNDFMVRGYMTAQERLDTVSGRWEQLKNRIDDAWKEMGAAIAQNGLLTDALHRAGEAVKAFGERVRQWVESGGVTRLVYGFRVFYEDVRHRFQLIGNVAHIAFAAIGDGSQTLVNYVTGVFKALGNVVTTQFQSMGRTATAAWNLIRRPGRAAFNELKQAVRDSVDDSIESYKQLGNAIAGENTVSTKRTEAALDARAAYKQDAADRMAKTEEWYTNQVEGEATERVKAERDAQDDILGSEAAALAERDRMLKERADLEKRIEQETKKAADQRVKDLRGEIRTREDLAKSTVAQYLADQEGAKAAAKERQQEAKRAENLRGRQARGVRLSRADREFLEAFDKIEAARKDVTAGGALQKQLAEAESQLAELHEQTQTLDEMNGELHKLNAVLDSVMRAQ